MIKRILLTLLVLICNNLAAQDYVIRGFLHDASNGEPVSDERVKVLKQDSTPIAVGYSNIAGFFSVPKLPMGAYILKGTYHNKTKNITDYLGTLILNTPSDSSYHKMTLFFINKLNQNSLKSIIDTTEQNSTIKISTDKKTKSILINSIPLNQVIFNMIAYE
jgi:hypothetical protein